MNKTIFIFICLISTLLCQTYLPFKKDKDFDIEGLCAYSKNSINYVKPCEEGKYCKTINGNDLSICSALPNETILQSEGEACKNDFECEDGLYCRNSKCSIYSSSECGNNQSPYLNYNNGRRTWTCKITKYLDYCYYRDLTIQTGGDFVETFSSPSLEYSYNPLKVCGKMEIKKRTVTNKGDVYAIQSIESTYIGTLKDGEWVYDERACESGYALYFYGDGTLVDPSPNYTGDDEHSMFKKCVTPKSIDTTSSSDCVITYGNNDEKYNVNQINLRDRQTLRISNYYDPISHSYSDKFMYNSISSSGLCSSNLLKKLEMFKKYTAVFTEEKQKECEKNKYYDEPETCRDNELRKLYYYYQKPEYYELYYDEDGKNNDVINYLIQSSYKSYQSSGFLSFKYFISILLFLIIF
jgi:hypothetical protein